MKTLFGRLVCLMALLIPFDHRYDKWCRFFSLKLIPEGLLLPTWYEKKIYIYGSDLLSLLLFILSLYAFRFSFRKLWSEQKLSWLFAFFFLSVCSIVASPLCGYPIAYLPLLQLLTPILLFVAVTNLSQEWIRSVLWCFFIGGTLQALLGISQYFLQHPLGLYCLGELKLNHQAGTIPCPHGARWFFDRLFGFYVDVPFLRRASGTLNHSNLLGSFLLVSLFSSFALFKKESPRWQLKILSLSIPLMIFASILTFSRAALFTGSLGCFLYFYFIKTPTLLRWIVGIFGSLSLFVCSEQILERGGVFNYNQYSLNSDTVRIEQNKPALQMIAKHPFLGVGFKQFTYTPEWNDFSAKEAITMVHNSLLLVAAETGLVAAFVS